MQSPLERLWTFCVSLPKILSTRNNSKQLRVPEITGNSFGYREARAIALDESLEGHQEEVALDRALVHLTTRKKNEETRLIIILD